MIVAGSGVDDFVFAQALIYVDGNTRIDAEGTDTAGSMPDKRLHLISGDHLRLLMESILVFSIVYTGCPLCDDKYRPFLRQQ